VALTLRETATRIVEALRRAGHEAYFVGGCVRDRLMGLEPLDYDIVTSARPEQVQALFPSTVAVGAAFGVMVVVEEDHQFEVATFRSDGAYVDGRHPTTVRYGTAAEDIRRRDFTINGMLYDPTEDRVIDLVGGRDDIRGRLIRTIGDPLQRFEEDRLRMLRAIRFAARFDYGIEEATYEALGRLAAGLAEISPERIGEELLKILCGPNAGRSLRLMADTGLLPVILPEIQALVGLEQPIDFHPEGDVFEHTCRMLDLAEDPSPEMALGILLHDVGKPDTFQITDRIRFDEHDKVGAEKARLVCRRLRCSNAATERVVDLVDNHMRFAMVTRMRLSTLKRLLAMPYFDEHLELHRLDCLASHGKLDHYEFLLAKMDELSHEEIAPPPLINGHDLIALGYQAGPRFREILGAVSDAQLEGELHSHEEAIAFVRQRYPLDAQ